MMSLPLLPRRAPDTHKGTYGRVLILAGSPEMPGAAILAARAALCMGSGLVTCAIPAAIGPAVGAAVPEAIQSHLDGAAAVEKLRASLGRCDAAAAGPGLGDGALAATLAQVAIRHG